jgi:hypothetical protein
MGSLRSIREEARREKKQAKDNLIGRINELLQLYGRDRDYLARMVDELNAQDIRTLNGMSWTTRNLWQFLATNEGAFDVPSRSDYFPVPVEPEISRIPPKQYDLDQLLEWARHYRKYGVLPLVMKDMALLEQVEARLEEKEISLGDLITELLEQWLKLETEQCLLLPEHGKSEAGKRENKPKKSIKRKGNS